MINLKFDTLKRILEDLENLSSTKLFIETLKGIFCRDNIKIKIFIFLICLVSSYNLGISSDTVRLFEKIVVNANTIMLALFGIVFMGYVFFQTLVNNKMIINLLVTEKEILINKKKIYISLLEDNNNYFVKVMMLIICSIFVNTIIIFNIVCLNDYFTLTIYYYMNNIIAIILIQLYMFFTIYVIVEMKSFVFNLYQLYNLSAVAKVIKQRDDGKINIEE